MKMLETEIFTASINEEKYYGFVTEANDFNYFFENNKIINVDIGFGGTGFVIGKPLGTNQFKCIKEIYGSGVSIVAEDSFIGTIDGNVLRFDNDTNEFGDITPSGKNPMDTVRTFRTVLDNSCTWHRRTDRSSFHKYLCI